MALHVTKNSDFRASSIDFSEVPQGDHEGFGQTLGFSQRKTKCVLCMPSSDIWLFSKQAELPLKKRQFLKKAHIDLFSSHLVQG